MARFKYIRVKVPVEIVAMAKEHAEAPDNDGAYEGETMSQRARSFLEVLCQDCLRGWGRRTEEAQRNEDRLAEIVRLEAEIEKRHAESSEDANRLKELRGEDDG